MRLIQPYPDHCSVQPILSEDKVKSPVQVYHIRYRYAHHATASGYDRLCDYIGETIQLSHRMYWMGETLYRLPAILRSKLGGHAEYSRYDYVMEQEVIRHFLQHHNSLYHFVYGEKSFERLARYAGRNGNKIMATMHQPVEKHVRLFRSMGYFRSLDYAVVVSRSMIPFWENVIGPGRVKYVPYAVDTTYFTPRIIEKRKGPFRCLFAGMHDRDFECLAKVVPLVLEGNRDIEFHMVSSSAVCGEIAARNSRAVWKKRINDSEYRDSVSEAHLLVMPTRLSTANTAVLEAMACGLPVVANHGGMEDYLDVSCSRILPVGDAEGMAAAVLKIAGDPELWTVLSRAARLQAERFSWTNTANAMAGIYGDVMSMRD